MVLCHAMSLGAEPVPEFARIRRNGLQASRSTIQILTSDVQSKNSWIASMMLSGATIQVTPEVFSAGVLATLASGFKAKEKRGLAYEASFSDLQISHTLGIPLVSKGVKASVYINSLKWRLEVLVNDATGETTFRDFQFHLGHVTVKTKGLWYLDHVVGASLNVLLEMTHDTMQRIGQYVGRNALRQSF